MTFSNQKSGNESLHEINGVRVINSATSQI